MIDEDIIFHVFNALMHTMHTDDCFIIDVLDSFVCKFVQNTLEDPVEATLASELHEEELDEEQSKLWHT